MQTAGRPQNSPGEKDRRKIYNVLPTCGLAFIFQLSTSRDISDLDWMFCHRRVLLQGPKHRRVTVPSRVSERTNSTVSAPTLNTGQGCLFKPSREFGREGVAGWKVCWQPSGTTLGDLVFRHAKLDKRVPWWTPKKSNASCKVITCCLLISHVLISISHPINKIIPQIQGMMFQKRLNPELNLECPYWLMQQSSSIFPSKNLSDQTQKNVFIFIFFF